MTQCNEPVRGGGNCRLAPGHRGYHSTVTFGCDGCGKEYRGQPHAVEPVRLGDGSYDDILQFCFLCSAPQVLDPHGLGWHL